MTRIGYFVVKTHLCYNEAMAFKDSSYGCCFLRIFISMISHKNTTIATPFYETIGMTILVSIFGIEISMHCPWDYDNRVSYYGFKLNFETYISLISIVLCKNLICHYDIGTTRHHITTINNKFGSSTTYTHTTQYVIYVCNGIFIVFVLAVYEIVWFIFVFQKFMLTQLGRHIVTCPIVFRVL